MKKTEVFIIALLLVVISGLSLNILLMLSVILPSDIPMFLYQINFGFIFIISFILLPAFVYKVLPIHTSPIWNTNVFNYTRLLILFLIIFPLSILLIGLYSTTEYLIVAFCEEFLFRHILLLLLISYFNKNTTYILDSLLFSLVLHINGDFWINLFTKFPVSLFLYWLTQKYKLQDAIAFHWIYNVLVYRFS
ncbi:CPBP family glutamic-type intramembrane protease [Staphylococcus caeli]|uniref:CPBP family glutamic-type intramembrane protease n=1 Tax=Staphylococcus caeli TaxID=2201815 RepID=UPI003F57B03F